MFFFQFLVQAGFFFVVPLYLSVALGLSAHRHRRPAATALGHAARRGARHPALLPQRLAAARRAGRPPRRCSPGTVVLLAALDADAGPEIVFVPMLLVGLGIGALASQLGAVTVSAVPDDQSPEVGGVQNTMTNLGASLGTALAGSVMIAAVTPSFVPNIQHSQAIPADVKSEATVELAGGVPFVSDADLESALDDAGASDATTQRRARRPMPTPASTGSSQRSRSSRRSASAPSSSRSASRARSRAARRPSPVRQRLLGPVAAGGSSIDARKFVSGLSGTRMRPRVGRSRSNVTRSSRVTRPAARRTVITPRPRRAR